MYIVYLDNQFCVLGKEYLRKNKNTIVGYHHPGMADVFKTKKDTQELIKYINRDSQDIKITSLNDELEKFDKTDWKYRELPALDLSIKKFNNNTDDEVFDFWINYRKDDGKVSYEIYKSWPDLRSIYDHIWEFNKYIQGEYSFTIYTSKNGVFHNFKKELHKALPYVTLMSEDGYKRFKIFEHSLSESAVYYFNYKSDTDCYFNTHRTYSTKNKYNSLEKAFEFMKEGLWYDSN